MNALLNLNADQQKLTMKKNSEMKEKKYNTK